MSNARRMFPWNLEPYAGCIASLEHAATKYDDDRANLREHAEYDERGP